MWILPKKIRNMRRCGEEAVCVFNASVEIDVVRTFASVHAARLALDKKNT